MIKEKLKQLFFIGFIALTICVPMMVLAQQRSNINLKYAEEEAVATPHQARKQKLACGSFDNPIRIAGFVTNPPFGWMDIIPASGTTPEKYINDGFGVTLFNKLAKDLGYETLSVGFKSYHEAVTALKAGKIDVLLGSYYDKRTLGTGTSMLFPGYYKNTVIVVFLKGQERPVSSIEDLSGLKGVMRQEEMLYSLMYKNIPENVKIEQVSGARNAYTALMSGQADFLITSLYAAESEIRRFKITDKVVLTRTPLIEPELFFVFSSTSKCMPLKEKFSAQLRAEKEDPQNINAILFQQIDRWIERFRYAPPLLDEMKTNGTYRSEIVEDVQSDR